MTQCGDQSSRVSVIIPTYNRCQMLREAIHSVYAQTYKNFELIIIDDGSTDGTADYLASEIGGNGRVTVVTQPNKGLAKARNEGLRCSTGHYVALLDSDDIWLPVYLETQLLALQHENATFSIANGLCEEPDGTWQRLSDYSAWRPPLSAEDATAGTWIIPSFTMFAGDTIRRYKFDETLRLSEDTDLMIRLLIDGLTGTLNDTCAALYRTSIQGESQLTSDDDASLVSTYDVWKTYEKQLPGILKRDASWAVEFATRLLKAGRVDDALELLKKNI